MSDWQFPGQIERASKTLEIERLTDLATCIPSVANGQRSRHCEWARGRNTRVHQGSPGMHRKLSKRSESSARAASRHLQRDRQQRVDAAAVADDHALSKTKSALILGQDIHVASRREEIHGAVAHDAH